MLRGPSSGGEDGRGWVSGEAAHLRSYPRDGAAALGDDPRQGHRGYLAHRCGRLRAGVLLWRRHPARPARPDALRHAHPGGGPGRDPRPQGGVRGVPPGDRPALHPGHLQAPQPQLQQLQQRGRAVPRWCRHPRLHPRAAEPSDEQPGRRADIADDPGAGDELGSWGCAAAAAIQSGSCSPRWRRHRDSAGDE